MMAHSRQALTPEEFDRACRDFEKLWPSCNQTSGRRSVKRNAAVGGHVESKHILGMAKDYVFDGPIHQLDIDRMLEEAKGLGLWPVYHDTGSGSHLHVQGLPPGSVIFWWKEKGFA